jgi:restriction endonuclease S subunit
MVKLGDVCENLESMRMPVTKSDRKQGIYPYYGASGIVDYVDDYIFDGDYLLISEDRANLLARSTPIAFSISGITWVNNHAHVLKFTNKVSQNYVEYIINSMDISLYGTGSAQPKLNQKSLNSIPLPFPPLDIKKQIVEKLEKE